MRKWVLIFCCVLYGCGTSPEGKVAPTDTEPIKKIQAEKKSLYPTLGSYFEVIEFQDGVRPEGKPNQTLYYDAGGGINSINIAKFYQKNKNNESVLEKQKKKLRRSEFLPQVSRIKVENEAYEFLKKNIGIVGKEIDESRKNKALLDTYRAGKIEDLSEEEIERFLLLAEEDGDYELVESIQQHRCEKYPESCKVLDLRMTGWIKDQDLKPVPNTKIQILNHSKISNAVVNSDGTYRLEATVRPFQLIRVRFMAEGYMPYVKEIRIQSMKSPYEALLEVRLPRAQEKKSVRVEDMEESVESLGGTVYDLRNAQFKTVDDKLYEGEVSMYTYDFNPWVDDMGQVLTGSLRIGSNGGVAPEVPMVSFGMPYAQFFTEDGALLKISKPNPVSLTTVVEDPDAIHDLFRAPGEDADSFWDYWTSYSDKNGAFTSDQIERGFVAYWVYNIETGIWEEVPIKVLGEGKFQSILYTHN